MVLAVCSAFSPLAARAQSLETGPSSTLARATPSPFSLTQSDERAAARETRIASWTRTTDQPNRSNHWKAGAVIGSLMGVVIGGALAMNRIDQQHSGAGAPEYFLVNGAFPGFVIGGAIGAGAGALVHSRQ